MFKLIIEDDEGKTTVVPLIRDEITIGRKEGNTIRLTERNVSRRHAKLVKQNGAVYIEDLGSYNGIKVNGNKISGRIGVAEGDRIQIGDYLLALKLDRAQTAGRSDAFADAKTQQVDRPTEESLAAVRLTTDPLVPAAGDGAQAAAPAAAGPAEAARAKPEAARAAAEALPDEALDAQPTIPVQSTPERPARLVVLSSNFAGQEFLIDKAKLVIGRVDDNDIVINHRSISRHHASIVREHGRYNIVDLQSANGVRVNGEEYGKVELRRGDIIDLGHVRLRFVEPGEDFVFDRDATLVDVPVVGRSINPAMAVFALLLALFMVGFVFRDKILGSKGGTSPSAADAATAARGSGPGNGSLAETEVPRLLREVDEALAAQRWDEAIQKSDRVLKLRPDEESAREKLQRAQVQKKYQDTFERYKQAVAVKDFDRAASLYGEIKEDSPYKALAQASLGEFKSQYVKNHLKKAHDLVGLGHCAEAKAEVDQIETFDEPAARQSADWLKKCGAPKEKTPPDRGTKTAKDGQVVATPKHPPKPPPVVPEVKTPVDNEEADKLAEAAEDAYTKGHYQKALDLCNQARKINPRHRRAVQLLGATYCKLKDKGGAARMYGLAADVNVKNLIKGVCHAEEVEIP